VCLLGKCNHTSVPGISIGIIIVVIIVVVITSQADKSTAFASLSSVVEEKYKSDFSG
jgi:hypothetical protein